MDSERQMQVYPTITHIKYSEPKFMTYLAIIIIIGLVFVSSIIFWGFDYSRRLDRVEKKINTLQSTMSTEVISRLKSISDYIEVEKSTYESLLDLEGIDLQKGVENDVSTKETEM